MRTSNAETRRRPLARRIHYSQPQLDLLSDVGQSVLDHWREAQSRNCPFVRIINYTTHPIDEWDNLKGGSKFLVDLLRYAKLIPNDRKTEVEIEISQVKVRHYVEAGVHVQIFYPTQS